MAFSDLDGAGSARWGGSGSSARASAVALGVAAVGVVLALTFGPAWAALTLAGLAGAAVIAARSAREERALRERLASQSDLIEVKRTILSHITDGVLTVAGDGSILFAGGAISEVFGYVPEALIGRSVEVLVVEELREALLSRFRDGSIAGPDVSSAAEANRGRRSDGSVIPICWTARRARIDGRDVFTVTVRDHSAFVKNQQALEQVVGELRSKVATLESVVTTAAEGNLAVVVPEVGDDALGRLGSSLGRMVGSLRELVGEVKRSGMEVAGAATDLAASTEQHESSASEQAAAVDQISATARRIYITSQALVETVAELDSRVQDSADRAARGRENLDRMHSTMDRLSEASQAIGVKLGTLSDKAANITSVVQTIAKVADQTNLLSLNAAIEAEKAGEYGRGFSVVAAEIRRLADQTAVATLDIGRIVKEIQSAVDAGVIGMEHLLAQVAEGVEDEGRASDELAQIISQVGELGPHFTMVCERMQSQAAAAAQISDAVDQLGRVTQHTADALSASGASLRRLNQAASGMQAGVSRFVLGAPQVN